MLAVDGVDRVDIVDGVDNPALSVGYPASRAKDGIPLLTPGL